MKKRIITNSDLEAHKLPDKIGETLHKSRKTFPHKEALAVQKHGGDDAALLYTHERLLDMERRMVATLKEYRNLLDLVGGAVADAKEAKEEALRERAARQVLQGEMRAFAVAVNDCLVGLCGVSVPLPDFDVEALLKKGR